MAILAGHAGLPVDALIPPFYGFAQFSVETLMTADAYIRAALSMCQMGKEKKEQDEKTFLYAVSSKYPHHFFVSLLSFAPRL